MLSGTHELYNLTPIDVANLINTQLNIASYLIHPLAVDKSLPDQHFSTNEELWRAIITEKVHANVTVHLEGFLLFEWFPRSPGLFHTDEGREARESAMHCRRPVSVPRLLDAQMRRRDQQSEQIDFLEIFDPYGKSLMLNGGIGCIRLRPKVIDEGTVWFLSASSTAVAHEGFPVAVPDTLFQRHVDMIKREGALRCTVRGKLKFMPESMIELYRRYRGVPQVYLLADDLAPQSLSDDRGVDLLVTVGIGFLSSYEAESYDRHLSNHRFGPPPYEPSGAYASYASFNPRLPGALDHASAWLEEVYVKGIYEGTVVTDFDEQLAHFSEATFSLSHVLNNRLDAPAVQTFIETVQIDGADLGNLFAGLQRIEHLNIERVEKMENKKITIANSTVSAPIVIAETVQESFNVPKNAKTDQGLKELLDRLLKAVAEAGAKSPGEAAEYAARDAKHLVEEATATKARPDEALRFAQRVKEWATTIGEVGKPIVQLVGSVLPLLNR